MFGRQAKEEFPSELIIGSRGSDGYYSDLSELTNYEGKLYRDSMSRSITNLGDINGDLQHDLLRCVPLASVCYLYLGKDNSLGFQGLPITTTITESDQNSNNAGTTLFGYATTGTNDVDGDGFQDFLISAPVGNIIYLFFGQPAEFPSVLIIPSQNNVRIVSIRGDAGSGLIFLGIVIVNAKDFNGDGLSDFFFTTMNSINSQTVLYLVFGRSFWPSQLNCTLLNDSNALNNNYLRIYTEISSFAGYSIAGIGDIDHDGYADIAIGSLPYQGGYQSQKTFILFGRRNELLMKNRNFYLSSLKHPSSSSTTRDGLVIKGGGFMIAGTGDVNEDGIDDFMIVNYPGWQGKGNSYFMVLL